METHSISWWDKTRSWWDVNSFTHKVIRQKSYLYIITSLAVFITGAVSACIDLITTADATVIAGEALADRYDDVGDGRRDGKRLRQRASVQRAVPGAIPDAAEPASERRRRRDAGTRGSRRSRLLIPGAGDK